MLGEKNEFIEIIEDFSLLTFDFRFDISQSFGKLFLEVKRQESLLIVVDPAWELSDIQY